VVYQKKTILRSIIVIQNVDKKQDRITS